MQRKKALTTKMNSVPRNIQPGKVPREKNQGPYSIDWNTKVNRIWMLAIVVLTFIVVSPSLKNGFTNWDDNLYVTHNPLIGQLDRYHIKDFFTTDFVGNYHPLTMISLAIDHQFAGGKPFLFHFTNMLFHLLNTLLVFLLAWKLTRGNRFVSAFTALVFGIHPMHIESVTWISERKDVLYTFFFLIASILYIDYQQRRSLTRYLLIFVLFVLSCLSKSAAVVLPVLFILFDLYLSRITLRNLLEKVPFLVISVLVGLKALETQAEFMALAETNYFTFPERIRFASYGFITYIIKFFIPFNLSAYHYYPREGVPYFYTISIGLVILLFLAAILIYKKDKLLWFGLLFYSITIALVLQFITLGNAIIAERYTYVPYIGIAIVVGTYLHRLQASSFKPQADLKSRRPPILRASPSGHAAGRPLIYALAILFLLTLSIIAFNRTKVWKDSETLWTDVIRKYPGYDMGYVNRGHHRRSIQQYDESLQDYAQAIRINPSNYRAYNNRGKIYFDRGEVDLALWDIDKAIALNPGFAEAYSNRGAVYAMKRDYEKAVADLDKSIELDPEAADSYFNRANLHYQFEVYDKAMKDINTYLFMNPGDPDAINLRGLCYLISSFYEEAMRDFEYAIRINPDDGRFYLSRSYAWQAKGDLKKALDDALKARSFGAQVEDDYIKILKEVTGISPSSSLLFKSIDQ
jgi:tetratricopeptide (TPR) repeat protein